MKLGGWGALVLFCLSVSPAQAETVYGGTAGNGNDSLETTFHFQSQNINVRLTKPDGTLLSQAEVPAAYGSAFKIFSDSEDWLAKLGLQAVGADLSAGNWTDASFPGLGQVAVDPASGRCKFASRAWTAPYRLNPAATGANPVYAAINSQGLALFARTERATAWYRRAFVNVYDPALGWQGPVPVDAGGNTVNVAAYVALNDSGLGLCLYSDFGSGNRAMLNTYQAGTGWQGAVQMDLDVDLNPNAQGVVLNNGGAGALFFAGTDSFWARNLDPVTGWGPARSLATYAEPVDFSDADINSTGQIACAYTQSNGVYVHIFVARYDPVGDTWSAPVSVDGGGGNGDSSYPAVDINDSGMIACTFKHQTALGLRQYANIYLPTGGGWQGPVIVDAIANTALATLSPYYSSILLEDSGRALTVFSQAEAPGRVLWTREYQPGPGWQTPYSLASQNDVNTAFLYPRLIPAGQGKMWCAYTLFNVVNPLSQPVYIEYAPTSGWGAPHKFGLPTSGLTALAANSSGWVAAGFQDLSTGTSLAYGDVYRVESPPGPVSVNYSYQSLTATSIPSSQRIEVLGRELKPLQDRKSSIAFDLDQDGWVSINVYSLRGDRVRTLTNQYYAAGSYGLEWGGENDAGQLVASGVYIIYTKLPGLENKQKVVVVK